LNIIYRQKMVENDCTDATHPRRAFAWGCAGGLSAVPLFSAYFFKYLLFLELENSSQITTST
jgi:hypothetical protein